MPIPRTHAVLSTLAAGALVAACSGSAKTSETSAATTSSGSGSSAGTGGEPEATSSDSSSSGSTSAASGSSSSGAYKPPKPPQVVDFGGPVLAAPKVQPIAYAMDTGLADMEAFLQEMTKTTYWSDTTSEYGVGALTILPTIAQPGTPPATLTDSDMTAALATNLTGANPAWGTPDSSTIYLFIVPPGTIVMSDGAGCTDFDGYHTETTVGGKQVPYAVSCSCAGFDGPGIDLTQERTVNMSHELVESATDPFPNSNPAYTQEDNADLVWTIVTGGEVADMCEDNLDSYYVPPGATYMIQRSWSNKAATALQNPCVPVPAGSVYFNSFAADGLVSWTYPGQSTIKANGLAIPTGSSAVVDVHLYSSAPTSGPWTVSAYDYEALVNGTAAKLDFSFDTTSGQSGDVLHMTVKVLSEDEGIGGNAFILFSDLGKQGDADFTETVSMGVVVP